MSKKIAVGVLTKIEIDKDALRFYFNNGSGVNLFWVDLFRKSSRDFQLEVMENLFKAYNECVKLDISPSMDEDE